MSATIRRRSDGSEGHQRGDLRPWPSATPWSQNPGGDPARTRRSRTPPPRVSPQRLRRTGPNRPPTIAQHILGSGIARVAGDGDAIPPTTTARGLPSSVIGIPRRPPLWERRRRHARSLLVASVNGSRRWRIVVWHGSGWLPEPVPWRRPTRVLPSAHDSDLHRPGAWRPGM